MRHDAGDKSTGQGYGAAAAFGCECDANAAVNIEFFDTQRHMRVRVWPFNIDIVQRFTGMCQGWCMCQPLRDLHVSCCCVQELGRDCQSGGNGHLTALTAIRPQFVALSTLGSVAAGHHLVQGNYEGIHTFQHPDFQRELSCLLGEDTSRAASCPRPDIVLINSGMHDARRGGNSTFAYIFEGRVAQLATRLRELVYQSAGKTKVSWVGSNSFRAFAEFPHVEVMALDAIARRYMTANDLPVIAVADMMQRCCRFARTFLASPQTRYTGARSRTTSTKSSRDNIDDAATSHYGGIVCLNGPTRCGLCPCLTRV